MGLRSDRDGGGTVWSGLLGFGRIKTGNRRPVAMMGKSLFSRSISQTPPATCCETCIFLHNMSYSFISSTTCTTVSPCHSALLRSVRAPRKILIYLRLFNIAIQYGNNLSWNEACSFSLSSLKLMHEPKSKKL